MNCQITTCEETVEIVSVRARVRVPLHEYHVESEVLTFRNLPDHAEHLMIGFGTWNDQLAPLVRMHSECLTGDVFGSARCDCGPQLKESIARLAREGGILLYLRQEGRLSGLLLRSLTRRMPTAFSICAALV